MKLEIKSMDMTIDQADELVNFEYNAMKLRTIARLADMHVCLPTTKDVFIAELRKVLQQ